MDEPEFGARKRELTIKQLERDALPQWRRWTWGNVIALGVLLAAWQSGVLDATRERLANERVLIELKKGERERLTKEIAELRGENEGYKQTHAGIRRLQSEYGEAATIELLPGPAYGVKIDPDINRFFLAARTPPIGRAFDELERIHHLKALEIANVKLSFAHVERIARLSTLASLRLRRNGLSDELLAPLANLRSLDELAIVDNPVRDLQSLARLPSLWKLSLEGTDIDDDSLRTIAKLVNFTAIERLTLRNTSITDNGLGHLSAFRQLRFLDIGSTRVNGSGLDAFGTATDLRVYADDTNVSTDTVFALAEKHGMNIGTYAYHAAMVNEKMPWLSTKITDVKVPRLVIGPADFLPKPADLSELKEAPKPKRRAKRRDAPKPKL